MVFSSAVFLFGFLPLLLGIYYISKDKMKNYVLLIFSLIFYAFGGFKLLLLMISVVMIDYLAALLIDRTKSKSLKKVILIVSILLNVGVLFYFKYTGFTVKIINRLISLNIPIPEITLPIGISFYTFQAMSYVIDVYNKKVSVEKNPFLVLLYVSMFPQLIAGPIVRYSSIADEIKKRKVDITLFSSGLERFILGLAKKLVIANSVGKLADNIFSLEVISTPLAWLGAISYALQIYFDFSAYSDMAIGLGNMLGFHFDENFNYPYISKSITEFWRRWHISLSTWFRDYVYIPLGGNKKGIKRQIINLFIVWLLTGLWHGAHVNFVLWGLYYFAFLVLEKFILKKVFLKLPSFVLHIYTIVVILVGWVIFRAEGISATLKTIKSMFIPFVTKTTWQEILIYLESYWVYIVVGIILSMPIFPKLKKWLLEGKFKRSVAMNIFYYTFVFGILVLSIMFLSQATYNPFIYFRF